MRLSLLTSQNVSFPSSKALHKPADGDMAVRSVSIQHEYRGSPKQIHLRGCRAWRCHNSGHSVNGKVKINRDVLWPAGSRNRCKRERERRRVKSEGEGEGEGEGEEDKPWTFDVGLFTSLVGARQD
jgi:hypothetical protein